MLLVEHIVDEQQHHLYEHIPFGFKTSLLLSNAITYPDKICFLQILYRLFLLLFRAQPDNPHCLAIHPLSLRSYPHYLRSDDILLAYSSSLRNRKTLQSKRLTLYHFHGLFNDYMPPNVIYGSAEALPMDNNNFKELLCTPERT
jgi:hypothetical protein